MKNIFKIMGSFVADKFPNATSKDHIQKLKNEADELYNNPEDIEEYADCILCIFGAANKQGFTYTQIAQATSDKLAKVKNRTWEKQPDGTYQHINTES